MKTVLLLLLFLCSSCGWKMGESVIIQNYQTISVPFVEGDREGFLTQYVIQELAEMSPLSYVNQGGDLNLLIKLCTVDTENVGFRYDRKKDGELIDYIIPTETRLKAIAEVTLVDPCQNTPLLGPLRIEAWVDFDHDWYSTFGAVNIFSLGQLNDYDEAYDAALKPLYCRLARKIVDYVIFAW